MKQFKLNLAFLAMFAMIFTSCSKEETALNDDTNLATLSFGAILDNLDANRAATKGHVGFLDGVPDCSAESPAYVEIIVSIDGNNVVGDDGDAYRVDLVNGQMFTKEDSALQLTPGNYSLDYFAVFSASGQMIWIAPMGGGDNLSNFVDTPLPMAIDLRAGVKKYVEVDVLCYDDRFVNEYGYLFFEINQNKAIEFCVFGNFCDEDGRHYPAAYTVDVWSYANGNRGSQLYNDVPATVEMNDAGDFAGSPVCFALPDTDGLDEYYFEITIRNSDAYANVEERIIRAGVINDGDVRDLMEGENNVEYYHFREGNCGDLGDSPDLFDAEVYSVSLSSMNNSGVSGTASLLLMDNKLTVKIDASGLEANKPHPQHIHGFENDSNAVCPPSPGEAGFAAADTNGDGVIDLVEGLPFYGPVMLELYIPIDEFPVADANGEIHFMRTFELGEVEFEEEGEVISLTDLTPLQNRTIVLHGMTFNGEYDATLPVACGQVVRRY